MALIIYPSEDSWCYENAKTTNYGTDTELDIKFNQSTADYRVTYIKFGDLSTAPHVSSIDKVYLRIYVTTTGDITDGTVYRVSASWTEGGVNWNNRPAVAGDNLATINYNNAGEQLLDITNTVKDWINGVTDNYGIRLWYAASKERFANIGSRENATVNYRPYLLFKLKPSGFGFGNPYIF